MNQKRNANQNDNEVANKNYQHIQELNKAYLKKQLIIFYGAGLSIPLGLPGWDQLLNYVIDKVIENPTERKKCKKNIAKNNFWDSMEEIKKIAQVTEGKIKTLIAECIQSSQDNNIDDLYTIDNNYKDLADSEINFFVTTNYDTFLEKVDNRCESYDIAELEDQPLAELLNPNEKKKKIIYLHGHVNNESSIVITKEAIEKIYQNQKWISIFQTLLTNYHILFIGVSFNDEYLRSFLSKQVENSNNNYFVITNKDVDIKCKKIVIPPEYDQRVFHIRKILDKIKERPEETIWIRIRVEDSKIEKIEKSIKGRLDKMEGIKYEFIKQEKYLIIAVIHMKKSDTIMAAFTPYRAIFDNKNLNQNLANNNIVYFYSCNKDNFNEIDYKRIFKNHIIFLFQQKLDDNSNGYIIDRIGLGPNDENTNMIREFMIVRCNLYSDTRKNSNKNQKDYTFYVDENISISGAVRYGVEVHVSGFCFFNDKLLMENRSQKTAIAAGMIAPIGGRMRTEEDFEQALKRHFRDDCNLLIDNIKVYNVFSTYNANIPGVAFICNSNGISKKRARLNAKYSLYTKEQLLDLYNNGKLACEKELLLEAFEQKQKNRKKSIKLRIVLWTNCCFKCQGCHHENLSNTTLVPDREKILQNLIKLGKLFDVRQITITGGEPMQDIKQLGNLLREISYHFPMTEIAIITNGEKVDGQLVDKFAKYNVRYKMSLYGFDNESFKNYTRYGGYKKDDYITSFQNKLQILNDRNIRYTVNIPIHKYILSGLVQLLGNEKMQQILLKQDSEIKLIDMVKPRSEENGLFPNLYVPIEEARQSLLYNSEICDSDDYKRIKGNLKFFTYPCKGCNSYNENCFENFALTIEPNGNLLVCRNAVEQLYINDQSFEELLADKGIDVEFAEYNRDYG